MTEDRFCCLLSFFLFHFNLYLTEELFTSESFSKLRHNTLFPIYFLSVIILPVIIMSEKLLKLQTTDFCKFV